MKRSLVLLCLFLATACASAQTATQPAGDCAALTHQALELSGFNLSIDYLTASLVSDQFMQQMGSRINSSEFVDTMKPVLLKEFSGELLRREMQNRMAAHCNPEQMSQTVQKLQTPFIGRML